ncbi:MAG: hypothetical protein A2084_03900 [Tenericutes bacterium GWC2_39_45]|nr:MAG: hypothetical protein A2084_03900 [Tenericutes bacterium GWC2_39_45]OHE32837.1 MAG: hypothetical protein A2009_00670 [Tenericutes bacterium GWD2_38_27]OHE39983.1 MAG: hypothetical protein A2013_04805 [Tenericutes bacterium GWE2_38_8]OHE41263.1 MAG: hypothetical protein A2102_01755 [Tenericutes bacterium GWF2_38_8]HBG32288.1 hypothetical protein [Acholeplasmataceae bacterium]
MFKRLATSLSRPQFAVFFIKDSWIRTILYILLLPLFLIIPALITSVATDEMSVERYTMMVEAVETDFRIENASITDGVLSFEGSKKMSFDYFSFYVGDQDYGMQTLNFVFEETELVLFVSNVELDRETYVALGLLNHDFSLVDSTSIRELSTALKIFMERQDIIGFMDVSLNYTIGLLDYLFITILMSLLMVFFSQRVQLPILLRFKLSVYLSTIWVFSELVLKLFSLENLEFISIFTVYFYHLFTYRSMNIVTKGVK